MDRPCKVCGQPVAPGARLYCAECRRLVQLEQIMANNRRYRQRAKGKHKQMLAEEKAKAAAEKERATQRAEHTPVRGWTDADVVRCTGCTHWRDIGSGSRWCMACHYPLDTGRLRPMPSKDCYRHPGTPYRPKE